MGVKIIIIIKIKSKERKKMSGIGRVLSYARTNPVAVYLAGGVALHLLRSVAVNSAYTKHFA